MAEEFSTAPAIQVKATAMINQEKTNEQPKNIMPDTLKEIESRLEAKIDAKLESTVLAIKEAIKPIQAQVTQSVEKSVSKNMTKAWSEALTGDLISDDAFPSVNDPQSRNAPVKPKITLKTVLKEAATEQKKEDLDREKRLKNIIIYRAPELHDESGQARSKHDDDIVNKLLETLNVNHKPTHTTRIGKFTKPKEGETVRCRPLRLTFENHNIQQEVLKNATKLKEAEDQLKQLSITYDLSEEERNTIKTLVEEAREMSKNSTTHEFKVRGPPWNLEIKRFKLR